MSKLVRIMLSVLLVAFATTSTFSVAQASGMALKMALVQGGTMDAAECGECGAGDDSGAMMPCDIACPTSPILFPSTTQENLRVAVDCRSVEESKGLLSLTGSPNTNPPQTIILS